MSESFDFLVGDYRKRAADILSGTVVFEKESPFSVEIMDAVFNCNGETVDALHRYFQDQGLKVRRIIVVNALITDLERGPAGKMTSSQKLFVVKDVDGNLNAALFTGCQLE